MTEQHSPEVEIDENQLIAERQKKLALIRESEGPTFPNDFRRSHRAGELAAAHGHEEKEELAEKSIEVAVCGRIMLRRIMGKASFLTIQDVGYDIKIPPQTVFYGWMFASSPAVSSLEHAVYDVSVLTCAK